MTKLVDPYERIEYLLRFNDCTQRQLSAAVGLDESAISRALKKKNGLKGHWKKLADFFGVTIDWLVYGNGPSPAELANEELRQISVADTPNIYRPGPATIFPVARPTIAPSARQPFIEGQPGQLPMVGTVSAGAGDVSFVDNPRRFMWPKDVAIYQVIGNSAYPVAFDGQFIIAKPHRQVKDQNLVVVETIEPGKDGTEEKKAYLKRYCEDPRAPDGFLLASVNIGYHSVIIPKSQISVMIAVIGVLFEEDLDITKDIPL